MFFFQEGLYVLRTDTNLPGGAYRGFIEQTCFSWGVYICLYLFVNLLSHRTDTNLPRNPYVFEHSHANFPGASIFSSNKYSFFQEALLVPLPPSNRYFSMAAFEYIVHLAHHCNNIFLSCYNMLKSSKDTIDDAKLNYECPIFILGSFVNGLHSIVLLHKLRVFSIIVTKFCNKF